MPAYDNNNPFAKILRGEFPCYKVYENEHVLAFLDIMPRVPGHTLVIPKAPVRNILDISEEDYLHVGRAVRTIARAAKTAFAADGITVSRPQVWLDSPIKVIGQQKVTIAVHPEVETSVTVTVARSAEEAERIKRGEDISTRQEDQDAAAEALAAAGEFFDPEAQHDDEAAPAPAAEEK